MLICKKCNAQNPLGRVFCGSCGAKLDLTRMSSDEVQDLQQVAWIARRWPMVIGILALAIVAMAAAAFVPSGKRIGEAGTAASGGRVTSPLRSLQYVAKGRSIERTFTEAEINGYFRHFKVRKMPVKSVSVASSDGYFAVRIVRAIGPLEIGTVVIEPKISYDLMCVPVGGAIRVRHARMGQMPLLGPLKTLVVRRIHRVFAQEKEWAAFAQVKEIRAEKGKITLRAEK